MIIKEIKEKLKTSNYNFLREDKHLGKNICLLTLGGSHAYSLETPTSDLDIRGIATHLPEDLFGTSNFEQLVINSKEPEVDATIYGLRKIFNLWLASNPNTVEILGCKPEHYLYLNEIGEEILNNKHLFLSKRCISAFMGYATAQLARLENYVCKEKLSQPKQEEHILNSVESAMRTLNLELKPFADDIRFYIDKAVNEDMETEIFLDGNFNKYPVRDYNMIMQKVCGIIHEYKKIGHRNNKKDSLHLNKHIMHLIRLLLMVTDLLETGEIITYREKDRDYLMSIRNGLYMDEEGNIKKELYTEIEGLKSKIKDLEKTTNLPDKPYMKDCESLLIRLNKKSLEMSNS